MIVDVGQIIALLIAAAGLFLSAGQVRMQRREQRMGQIVHLYERLYDDPAIQAMYRRLERGLGYPLHPTASVPAAQHDRLEEQLDRLLGLLQIAARLYQMRLVAADDLDAIAYEYLTVHQDPDVQAYLDAVQASNRARGMDI
ncbi:MAG TPA: hypothetical protein VK891_04070, partial [Euzebyales bacterium]|nr:hypothetical protein [Euzebyales bacterium]